MKWPIVINLPKVFGWSELAFSDRLKLMAFLAQGGAGVAMTAFAGYAMFSLAKLKATWPLFYLGLGALTIVGIVITGFAGLLIVRQLEIRGPGGFVFKTQDAGAAGTAQAIIKEMPSVQHSNEQDLRGSSGGATGSVDLRLRVQDGSDKPSGQDAASASDGDQQSEERSPDSAR